MADQILVDCLVPLAKQLIENNEIWQWFFVRYADPDFHIRFRMDGNGAETLDLIVRRLRSSVELMVDSGLVHRLEIGTYETEIDRYGGHEALPLFQEFFCVNSVSVAQILAGIRHKTLLGASRQALSALGMHQILNAFSYSLDERQTLLTRARDALVSRLWRRETRARRRANAEQFRAERHVLARLIDSGVSSLTDDAESVESQIRCVSRYALIAGQLSALEGADRLTSSLATIVPSVLHMHANRMAGTNGLVDEFAAYDLLRQTYRSTLGRQREATTK
jgi:thiopeptide-type bacteriocin biosynthesis protein